MATGNTVRKNTAGKRTFTFDLTDELIGNITGTPTVVLTAPAGGTAPTASAVTVVANKKVQVQLDAGSDGQHIIKVTAADDGGSPTNDSVVRHFVLDNDPKL